MINRNLLYQVMPFLLRRTKDEVLSDLPEKIIQDRYCNLSLLQLKLYDKFSTSNAKEEVSSIVKANESDESASQPKATRHVFQVQQLNITFLLFTIFSVSWHNPATSFTFVLQALQYLLKLCSHPLLVTGENPLIILWMY